MPDLSTPLLDSLNNKLTDPTMDCKTLEYNPNIFSSGESTTSSGQQLTTSSQQVAQNVPTLAPNTLAPTDELECLDDVTGPRQHNGCTGKYP